MASTSPEVHGSLSATAATAPATAPRTAVVNSARRPVWALPRFAARFAALFAAPFFTAPFFPARFVTADRAPVPDAAAGANRFPRGVRPSAKRFRRQVAPAIVRDAVQGIAEACIPDPDAMLRDLLVQAIGECAAWVGRDPNRGAVLDSALWVTAGQRTGGAADCR